MAHTVNTYRTVTWGPAVGMGVSGTLFVHLSAIGKPNNPPSDPYYVANEVIAAELGRLLRVPVPPGCVVVDPNGAPHYASLDFNLTGNTLPPIIPGQFVGAFGESACADIVTFDIYIGNSDRHGRNLSADYSNLPARHVLFDHSHCLFGGSHHGPVGVARLADIGDKLVTDRGRPHGNRHCLIDVLTDDRHMARMLDRIASIPDYFIDDVVGSVQEYGVSPADTRALAAFLKDRRHRLSALIGAAKPSFRGIAQWSFL